MQDFDWNDLKYLLATQRLGSFAKASQHLGVAETTISRRLQRLERRLGATLLVKTGAGRYALTDAARAVWETIEAMDGQAASLLDQLGHHSQKVAGTVRVSSVPFLINRVLVPNLARLATTHPDVTIDLVPDVSNVDLTKRDADLAVRFARPTGGGLSVKARKLGEMPFGVFVSREIPQADAHKLDWVGYGDSAASRPQARWIEQIRVSQGGTYSQLKVNDLETAVAGVISGHGKSLLPRLPFASDAKLREIDHDLVSDNMTRPVWLLSHADQTDRRAIRAVKDWLEGLTWSDP